MSQVQAALKRLLSDLSLFSELVLRIKLRPYQLEPLREIVRSVLEQDGREFLLVFPRQSGKNEGIAHLMVYLLNLFQRVGGTMVFGAVGDGLGRGKRRLIERLDNSWNKGKWEMSSRPVTVTYGKARAVFLSAHPGAAARGETASLLMVLDELQDLIPSHVEAVFEPMRAAENATGVYIGTVKTSSDLLWQKKKQLEDLERLDGRRRVFVVSPEQVSAQNPHYGAFLRQKIQQYGREHPIIKSEYFNEPIDGVGGLFGGRRLQLMKGTHLRQLAPDPAAVYVATLDLAGQDEAATDVIAALDNPGRDYTVGTIFEVTQGEGDAIIYSAVDVFVNQGSKHFESNGVQPSIANQLLTWLRFWGVVHLVADNTGVGVGLVNWLSLKLSADRVTGYTFTRQSKAALGNNFLATIETNRFKYFAVEQIYDDAWWFFLQCESCSYELPPGGRFDAHLRWSVAESVKTDVPGSGLVPVHDDRLVSAALVSVYDQLFAAGDIPLGRAASAVVRPVDPLEGLKWSKMIR